MSTSVSSIKDPRVALARSLQSAKGRAEHKKVLLYGREQLEWAQQAGLVIETVFALEGLSGVNWVAVIVTQGVMKKISNTSYLIPVMAIAALPDEITGRDDFIVVADDVKDFGNVGSLIRTARAFSVDRFLFAPKGCDPFQRKVIDSSRGLVFSSSINECGSAQQAVAWLREQGYQLVVTSPHAESLQSQVQLDSTKPIALVIGNESNGVSQPFIDAADVMIQIPMNPGVESLNVTVLAGISSYELIFKKVLGILREKIVTNLGRQVNVAGKLIRMVFEQLVSQKTDLSGEQVILLMIMYCDGTMTQEQISSDVGIEVEEKLEAFLKPLRDKQFIVREYDEFSITELGNQFLAQMWPLIEQANHKILSQFSDDEVSQLHELLVKLQIGCDEVMKESHED